MRGEIAKPEKERNPERHGEDEGSAREGRRVHKPSDIPFLLIEIQFEAKQARQF